MSERQQGHRVTIDWMGQQVETLSDLLRPGLRVICVGINPSPVSVAAGHYYQGKIGQGFWRRLRAVGLLSNTTDEWEDDVAFASGVGFTDIVKRPTVRAAGLSQAEMIHGRSLLAQKLQEYRPKLILFAFKNTAEELYGHFPGNGFLPRGEGPARFVMPGPYAPKEVVEGRLAELRYWLREA